MSKQEISVQLYTIHGQLDADLDGSLARLAAIGFRNVEAFNFVPRADEYKAAFARHGLTTPTAHAILIEDNVDTPDKLLTIPPTGETFAVARDLGVEIVIDPFVPAARWATREGVAQVAAKLNERAAQAAAYGLRVGYHNHDHELRSTIDGRTALEAFAELLDPTVALELDLYWAAAAGQQPAALLKRLGDRVVAVHAKDGPMRDGISTAALPEDQSPAGTGDVPIAATLAANPDVRFAVVEFDHYAGDIFEGVAASYAYLDGLQ